ncbi:MAG: prolyl oligopeptidase family serine peptidase [Chitinophagaceae bacterium]
MRRFLLLLFLFPFIIKVSAQKKPLDHSVYNSWQSIGERMISNDGRWIVYTIDVQEGDNNLVIQSSDANYKKEIPRGYSALITEDNRFVIFKIKPFFSDTKDAKIKKKKTDEFPKDSLAIVELGKEEVWKTPRVKGFRTPQKAAGWVAYLLEKPVDKKDKLTDDKSKRIADSLTRIIDSLKSVIAQSNNNGKKKKNTDADYNFLNDFAGDDATGSSAETGADLIVKNLLTNEDRVFKNVLDYQFSKNGVKLLISKSRDPKDSLSKNLVLLFDMNKLVTDTISRGGNDFRSFTMNDDGSQIAYVAERNAGPKDLQKFYKLWYYKQGSDSAILLADRFSAGMQVGMTVSENATLNFSKNGHRLFFGTAPIQPPKDTTIIEIDQPKVDIWHYNDDYLQTAQLNRLDQDLKQNFLAVYNLENNSIHQLASKELPQVMQTDEGDGATFVGVTDYGKRIESQWQGYTLKNVYAIDVNSGEKKLVKENLYGTVYPSSTGNFIIWYDKEKKNYFSWDGSETRNITTKIKVPLYDEENDVPDLPSPYGLMGWKKDDSALFVYDRYDIWQVDPLGKNDPSVFEVGQRFREKKTRIRYIETDPERRSINVSDSLLFTLFNTNDKKESLYYITLSLHPLTQVYAEGSMNIGTVIRAKNRDKFIYTKESFIKSPDLYALDQEANARLGFEKQLSQINPQQKDYNWGTVELFNWKAYNGKQATGLVYKPEDFDPKKKYPMICYYYEKLSDNLNNYIPPAPIRSAINVSFFVSRGYIIFIPDIEYEIGHPGRSAYNYIVSGARALAKKGWVDSTRMALQGHSWGGYQTAQLVTMTKLFKAAWAGAPVANMTSAYGGIRWETGLNRQFQYEKTQSRIGATLWDKPNLYIENSPLFHLKNVTTPLVIMHNDNDGAVPWYQGIELFTAMRRLGKKVWMFNYNGEGHGLTNRVDKLDYQIRMQQFFDWILKGESPAEWIIEGVPAVKKGKDLGLETGY